MLVVPWKSMETGPRNCIINNRKIHPQHIILPSVSNLCQIPLWKKLCTSKILYKRGYVRLVNEVYAFGISAIELRVSNI